MRTQGPWAICRHGAQILGGNGMVSICNTFQSIDTDPVWREQHLANANLIAAAPDMLAALCDAYQYMIDYNKCENSGLLRDMQAAIAKAKGQGA